MELDRTETIEDRIIREPECAAITGLSRTRRWELEHSGDFPRRKKLSERASGYLLSEIQAWIRARPCVPRAASDRSHDGHAKHEAQAIIRNDVKGAYCTRTGTEVKRTVGCVDSVAACECQDTALLAFHRYDRCARESKASNRFQCYQETSRARSCESYQKAKQQREICAKSLRLNTGNVQSSPGARAVSTQVSSASFGTWLTTSKCLQRHAVSGTVSYQSKKLVPPIRSQYLNTTSICKLTSIASAQQQMLRELRFAKLGWMSLQLIGHELQIEAVCNEFRQ